jgi:hypothetical protein
MPRKRSIVIVLVLACLLLAPLFLYYLYLRSPASYIRNAYDLELTAVLLVEYMKANNNEWPSKWSDLEMVMREHTPIGGSPEAELAHLQERVVVSWELDIDAFIENPQSMPAAVSQRQGEPSAWDANDRIRDYLSEQ